MVDLLSDFLSGLTWQKILVGALIFLASFFINLGIVSFILVKLPADHFSKKRKTKFWAGPRPAIHEARAAASGARRVEAIDASLTDGR